MTTTTTRIAMDVRADRVCVGDRVVVHQPVGPSPVVETVRSMHLIGDDVEFVFVSGQAMTTSVSNVQQIIRTDRTDITVGDRVDVRRDNGDAFDGTVVATTGGIVVSVRRSNSPRLMEGVRVLIDAGEVEAVMGR